MAMLRGAWRDWARLVSGSATARELCDGPAPQSVSAKANDLNALRERLRAQQTGMGLDALTRLLGDLQPL